MYITHEQRFIEPHLLYVGTDDIFVFYLGADRQAYIATKTSLFEVNNIYANAEFRGIPISLSEITIGVRCMIDNVEVSRQTFEKVRDLLQSNSVGGTTRKLNIGDDKMKPNIWGFLNEQAEIINRYSSQDVQKALGEMLNDLFGGIDMNKNITITNYKYDEKTGRTTLWWSDNTQTTVTADPDIEASQYVGFVSACAKKLFGNKSTYLNQFDKWTVKIPARQKAEAEKKAAEDKLNAEAKAKRDAKKAERKKKREIEKLAKQIADEYYAQELTEEAEKLAIKKYGVPKSYLDDYDCDRDNCNCKEFDVMDDNNITD